MKVAIPTFGPRVSPRFDCAPLLLLITLQEGKVTGREELSLVPWDSWQRLGRLKELQIQTLICGGIDQQSVQMLERMGIQVIPWVAGEAEEALEFFLEGRLAPGATPRSGCGRKRHRWKRSFLHESKKNI
jgi:predicted Fe-Mo cluster-binding NifX family protein